MNRFEWKRRRKTIAAKAVSGFCVCALAFCSTASSADYFSLELPGLVGAAPDYEAFKEVAFDFGRKFSRVDRLLFVVKLTGKSGLVLESCGEINDPKPCVTERLSIGLWVRLQGPDPHSTGNAATPALNSYPEFLSGIFGRFARELRLDHLKDGKGTLSVGWSGVSFLPVAKGRVLSKPTAEIHSFELLLEGVPEVSESSDSTTSS